LATLALLVNSDAVVSSNSGKSCKALIMSGGGSKGAWEAGALWGMYNTVSDKSQIAYDVVTGVSAGALNTAAVTLFAPGDEGSMVKFLSDVWATIGAKDVFKNWPLGYLQGLTDESGVVNNQPLKNTLAQIYKDFNFNIKRKMSVSCVDVNSGSYKVWNETSPDIVNRVVSSTAIPFVFPHSEFPAENVVCMDGGTVWNTNLVSAVQRCREQVDDDSQITLDILVCDEKGNLGTWNDKDDALNNYLRYRDISNYNNGMADVAEFIQGFPSVNLRYFIMSSAPLPSGLGILKFDNSTVTWPMQMQGRTDGANAIKQGEGFMFNEIRKWTNDKEIQRANPILADYLHDIVSKQ